MTALFEILGALAAVIAIPCAVLSVGALCIAGFELQQSRDPSNDAWWRKRCEQEARQSLRFAGRVWIWPYVAVKTLVDLWRFARPQKPEPTAVPVDAPPQLIAAKVQLELEQKVREQEEELARLRSREAERGGLR